MSTIYDRQQVYTIFNDQVNSNSESAHTLQTERKSQAGSFTLCNLVFFLGYGYSFMGYRGLGRGFILMSKCMHLGLVIKPLTTIIILVKSII